MRLDDAAELDANTAIITPNTVTGLDMSAGTPAAFIQTLTVGAGSFVLHFIGLDGKQLVTAPIAGNATAAAIQAAIAAVLNFDPARGRAPAHRQRRRQPLRQRDRARLPGPVPHARRRLRRRAPCSPTRASGVNYYGVETLDIALGSGNDVFNVQGTSARHQRRRWPAATTASTCPRGPPTASRTARPTSRATSNALAGTLNLDAGTGRHTLMISDEAATVGDNVRITHGRDHRDRDHRPGRRRRSRYTAAADGTSPTA